MFKVKNMHDPGCGTPPEFDTDLALFFSYFQGDNGDQWVCIYMPGESPRLYSGVLHWNNPTYLYPPHQGPFLKMSAAEQEWFKACTSACDEILRTAIRNRRRNGIFEERMHIPASRPNVNRAPRKRKGVSDAQEKA